MFDKALGELGSARLGAVNKQKALTDSGKSFKACPLEGVKGHRRRKFFLEERS